MFSDLNFKVSSDLFLKASLQQAANTASKNNVAKRPDEPKKALFFKVSTIFEKIIK